MPYTEKSLGLFLNGTLRRPVAVRPASCSHRHAEGRRHCSLQVATPTPRCRNTHLGSAGKALGALAAQEHKEYYKNIALSYAAYKFSNFMMPYYATTWNDTMHNLGLEIDNNNVDPTSPIGIGNLAGPPQGLQGWAAPDLHHCAASLRGLVPVLGFPSPHLVSGSRRCSAQGGGQTCTARQLPLAVPCRAEVVHCM